MFLLPKITLSPVLKFLAGLSLGLCLILSPMLQLQPDGLEALRTLAVQIDGRKKPLDTVAQETIANIHGSERYTFADGHTEDSLNSYLSLWLNTQNWNEEPFVLVSYRPLKEAVDLDIERKSFTFQALMGNAKLAAIVQEAHELEAQDKHLSRIQQESLIVEERLQTLFATVGDRNLAIVPHPTDIKGTWAGIENAATLYPPEVVAPVMAEFTLMKQVLLSGSGAHEGAVGMLDTQFQDDLRSLSPDIYPTDSVLKREVHFNHFHPFAKAWILYVVAFGVMLLTLWVKPLNFYWVSLGLFIAGIGVQAYGFFLRMEIAGRPPVTNMYESVVWVGFGIAAIALMFELLTRAKYYLLAAAPLAVVCLILADSLPAVLDPSIRPLVPVLRDNFWLSIHVPTIALSYASFALALGLGHVALANRLFAPESTQRFKAISQFNYRVIQVGVLLLTAGIILGGIWAHFSWGRFWGWDPKETWALIALLCYLAPLHGRLVGWISDFGMNVASVVSFNAILMAWYGVNFVLGTGLHSYGFATGGSSFLILGIVGLDLLFVAVVAFKQSSGLNQSPA